MASNNLTINEARNDTIDVASNSLNCGNKYHTTELTFNDHLKYLLENCSLNECEEAIKKLDELKNAKLKKLKYLKYNSFRMVRNGNLNTLKKIFESELDINIKDLNGNSLLHVAVEGKHTEIVKNLIQLGIDINGTNFGFETALHISATNGEANIVNILLNEGINIDEIDLDENTALHLAAKNGHLEVVKLLLKKNAKTNIKNVSGLIAFNYAKSGKVILEFAKLDPSLLDVKN